MQTRKQSIIEILLTTFIGMVISLIAQMIIYPIYNIPVTFKQNIHITIIFTFISIIRGYFIRRIFNNKK